MTKKTLASSGPFHALDFFAGSGLVRAGLAPHFQTVWANDNSPKKAAVHRLNFPGQDFLLGDICAVQGEDLPLADLAWASFPCQDLSLAGNMSGIDHGTRSGLFWQWLRILDGLNAAGKRPSVLCAENVVGFLTAGNGAHFKAAYTALRERGYSAGAVVVDARMFVPQSRPRTFLVAISRDMPTEGMSQRSPSAPFHTRSVMTAAKIVGDPDWIWWSLPMPTGDVGTFAQLCERDAPCDPPAKTRELLKLLAPGGQAKLNAAIRTNSFLVGTGYRRTRLGADGVKRQVLEIRFDGIAGCLRTPEGGSSRQVVLIVDKGKVRSRLMTVRECARLMGASKTYRLPESYNEGYRAMGDAVAVPVTQFLSEHLLAPLVMRRRSVNAA